LEAIPGRAADEARDKGQGKIAGGRHQLIGVRRDAKAVNGLIAKLKEADVEWHRPRLWLWDESAATLPQGALRRRSPVRGATRSGVAWLHPVRRTFLAENNP
jgi:hypothetical protein